jgi:hypothetical protein
MYMMFDGEVFVSANKGTTWTQTSFAQVTANPNDSFRMYGQKMAVDPNNPNIVYVGTPQNGLWVTMNGGTTWTQVTAVPVSGTSSGSYPGITGIMFDPGLGGAVNGVTQTIFASSYGNGVYESTNGGSTWTKLSGGPSDVEFATVGSNGAYYAVGNNNQNLWRYYNGAWTELIAGNNGQGIQAVAINPNNPNEIVAISGGGYLNVSYNGGTTWSGIDWTISVKSADIPWEASAQLSSGNGMYLSVGGAAFSETTPNELILSTGTGSFDVMVPTTSLTGTLTYNDMSAGIENLVANEVLVAPGGTPVLASWDRPFIQISNLDDYPTAYGPVASDTIVAGWSVDYASSTPSFLVGIADWWGVEESGYSTNGGATWTKFATEIPGAGSSYIGGTIAASTTQNFIWAPADGNQPYYTLNGGQTWSAITLPGVTSWSSFDFAYYLTGRTVTADRVLANTFYLYYPGKGVYETTNGGQTWTQVHSGAIAANDSYNTEIMSVPGEAGNLFWTAGIQGNGTNPPSNAGFYFSSDQGKDWTAIPNVLDVICFGFGAAAPGQTYPAIYIVGYVNKVYGIWQSINQGQSWTQIGTEPAGELDQITTISGDPNVFGRVYVGFGNGGGYAYLSGGPYVTSATANPSSGAEAPGATITFTVNMSAAVTVSGGTPTLTLNDGGVATYVSGSGTSALKFTYTVSSTNSAVSALAISSTSLNGATLQDTSGNAGTLAGAVTTFSGLSIVESVTVAYYLANQAALDAGGTVTISDTAANVASAIDTLNADTHVSAITLLGSTNLSLDVAQALGDTRALNAITNSSYGVTVTDTGANVSANFDALNADSHITSILPTDGTQAMTLTLTQMLNDTNALSLLDPFTISVTGKAASFDALTAAQIASFATDGVTGLDATDSDLVMTLAQTTALGAGGISITQPFASGTTEVVTYNATGGLATILYQGVTGQAYTSYTVTFASNGKPASASYSNGMTATWTYNANGTYAISYASVTGQAYTSFTVNYGANGKPTSATYGNGLAATWTYNANGTYAVSYTGVTGQSYTSFTVNFGTTGKPASATYSNGLAATWTYNSNGTYSISYTGVTGQAYTSDTVNYGANGKPTSATFSNGMAVTWSYNANGTYSVSYSGVTGQAYTSETINYGTNGKPTSATFSNGMAETWTYNANGTSSASFTGVTGQAYTSYTVNYGTNGKPTSATYSNGMTETWTYNTDGSSTIVFRGITGASQTVSEGIFNAAGSRVATAYDLTNGSGSLVLSGSGLTISSGASGALSLTTGSDTFALDAHTKETINATGYGSETFGFATGFGSETISGFTAAASGGDVLSMKLAMFSGLSASNTAAQNAAILLSSHAMSQSGSNVTITDTNGDSLTLMGVTTTALTQYASSAFKFS